MKRIKKGKVNLKGFDLHAVEEFNELTSKIIYRVAAEVLDVMLNEDISGPGLSLFTLMGKEVDTVKDPLKMYLQLFAGEENDAPFLYEFDFGRLVRDHLKMLDEENQAFENGDDEIRQLKLLKDDLTRLAADIGETIKELTPRSTWNMPGEAATQIDQMGTCLSKCIEDFGFTPRTKNALRVANINTLADLTGKSAAELLRVRNFYTESLRNVKEVLAGLGLTLRPKGVPPVTESVPLAKISDTSS